MVEPEERKIPLPPTLGLFVFQLGVVGGADWVSLAEDGRLAHFQQHQWAIGFSSRGYYSLLSD